MIDFDISPHIEIAPMSEQDIDDIVELESLCFNVPWSRDAFVNELTQNERAMYIIARHNNNVVAYAGMWKIFEEGHITNIAVHPQYRRKGVGSQLIEYMINMARKNNIKRMTLEVSVANIGAQNLYYKFGFCREGIRKKYYADSQEDAIIMWLKDI